MYSIVVNKHYQKAHKYVGFAFLIGIKEDGIDESTRGQKLYKTKKEARERFIERISNLRSRHE
jgi:hypothetical protein